MPDTQRAQRSHHGQHCGHAGPVVRNSRTVQAAALLPDVQRRACGKNRVQVGAERHVAVSVAGMRAKNIAYLVGVNRLQTELAEFVGQPLGPGALAERRRGNACQLQLPVRELRLLGAEPGESGANFRQRTEMCHLLLHSRKQLRDFGSRHGSVVGRQASVVSFGRWLWSLALGRWHNVIVPQLRTKTTFSRQRWVTNADDQRPTTGFPSYNRESPYSRLLLSLVDVDSRRGQGIRKFERD